MAEAVAEPTLDAAGLDALLNDSTGGAWNKNADFIADDTGERPVDDAANAAAAAAKAASESTADETAAAEAAAQEAETARIAAEAEAAAKSRGDGDQPTEEEVKAALEGKAPRRVYLGGLEDAEKVKIDTATRLAKAEGITFAVAWNRVSGQGGDSHQSEAEKAAAEKAATEAALPKEGSIEAMEAELVTVRASIKQSIADQNGQAWTDEQLQALNDKQAELLGDIKVAKLEAKLAAKAQAERAQDQQEASYASHLDPLLTQYPDALVPDSPLCNRCEVIQAAVNMGVGEFKAWKGTPEEGAKVLKEAVAQLTREGLIKSPAATTPTKEVPAAGVKPRAASPVPGSAGVKPVITPDAAAQKAQAIAKIGDAKSNDDYKSGLNGILGWEDEDATASLMMA